MKQVTAAVIIEEGRLFIARRGPEESLAGLWELPGGKIEPGESPQECLERELAEELGMEARVGGIVARTIYHYDHGSFEMLALQTVRLSDFALTVHDRFAWSSFEHVHEYPLAPADIELLTQLHDSMGWKLTDSSGPAT
ncbi:MAG: (deoxy)nucleoside triphosphate pyrophosphohydrolase [Coriobacteriia bacterium]|nr:(deoxy)nucleoside triphosphate pyrophosphohydrolase [Coriobacteriia bacterium]